MGAVRTGNNSTGVAAASTSIPLQSRAGEVGHAVAANEMQAFQVVQQHRGQPVDSLMYPFKLLLMLLSLYRLAHIFIVNPAVEKQREETLKQGDVPLTGRGALMRLRRTSPVAPDVIFTFTPSFGLSLWKLGGPC